MKCIILSIIFFFISEAIYSQKATKTSFDFSTYMLDVESNLLKSEWDLSLGFKTHKLKFSQDVKGEIIKWIDYNKSKSTKSNDYKYIVKYTDNLNKLFDNLRYINSSYGMFAYPDSNLPIKFDVDKGLSFMLNGVISDDIFNTLRLTSKQRASKIISSKVLPVIKEIYEVFENSSMKYIGVMVAYGSKDFSNDSDVNNLEPEVVIFIASMKLCTDYINAKIDEDDFINRSDIYLNDRDTISNIKKIKITVD